MRFSWKLRSALLLSAIIVVATAAAPVFGAPEAQTNLLANPSFEGNTYWQGGDSKLVVSEGWTGWWEGNPSGCNNFRPEYNLSIDATHVYLGAKSARYFASGGTYNAGLYQTVNVTKGKTYRFTIYGQGWATDNPSVAGSNSSIQMVVGIDPEGGSSPFVSRVVWSAAQSPMDVFAKFTVEAEAKADKITVFVRSKPDWCVAWNDTYWDEASLVEVDTSVTPTPQATSTPLPTATQPYTLSTPDASGRIIHTVQPGDTLSGIAYRYGVSTEQIKQLNNMANDLVFLGTQLIISNGTTQEPPTAEPTEEPTEAPSTEEPTEAPVTEQPTEPPANEFGSLCITSWDDSNGNGIREAGEERLAGVTFMLTDGSQLMGRYTTDGINEPYCFNELEPGSYVVSWEGSAFEPTTNNSWNVVLNAGSILTHDFGVRAAGSGADAPEPTEAPDEGMPTWLIATIGAVIILVVFGGGGAAVYFLILRREEI